jgi:diacylglycerol kinase (ATP)
VALPSDDANNLPDLILVNPAAGGGRAAESVPGLKEFARQQNWRADFRLTASAEELAALARAAVAERRPRIFVLGGDGTFQILVNAIGAHTNVILGVLPAGGGNDLAVSLGLPPDAIFAAKLLLDGSCCFLDAVRVRTADGMERLYTGGGGVGLDAEAARYAGGIYRKLRGRLRYLLSAIRALMGFHRFQVRVQTQPGDLQDLACSALLLGILNTPSYGAGLRLAPEAKTDDGLLDLVLLEDLGFVEVVAMLPALFFKGDVHTRRLQRRCVRWARIETDRPCAFHGDGEILGSTPVEIEIVPRALLVLCPRRSTQCV